MIDYKLWAAILVPLITGGVGVYSVLESDVTIGKVERGKLDVRVETLEKEVVRLRLNCQVSPVRNVDAAHLAQE